MVTCRQPAAMRVAASNIVITRAGAKPATLPNTIACWPLQSDLPALRAGVAADLQSAGIAAAQSVLAAVVSLLEASLIRVGNEEYSRSNGSFGLTTLKNRHVRVRGESIHFSFRGKSGKFHDVSLDDSRLARIVRRCQELPGQALFQFPQ